MELFNKALLAKQGWWILQLSNSLAAKVLKERYFHSGEFLSALLCHISYLWRSILQGRDLLTKCLRWRIVDGKTIRTFVNPWLNMTPTTVFTVALAYTLAYQEKIYACESSTASNHTSIIYIIPVSMNNLMLIFWLGWWWFYGLYGT